MCAQNPDYLSYCGQSLVMRSFPWGQYKYRPDFLCRSSRFYRGYQATWEIQDGRLYLTSIDAILEGVIPFEACKRLFERWVEDRAGVSAKQFFVSCENLNWKDYYDCIYRHFKSRAQVSVEQLFPGSGGKVLANWYTGDLECNYGRVLSYGGPFIGPMADICENYISFRIVHGVVTCIGTAKDLRTIRRIERRSESNIENVDRYDIPEYLRDSKLITDVEAKGFGHLRNVEESIKARAR